jgi:hypothetical protein
VTEFEKDQLLKDILDRIDQVSQRRGIDSAHSQALRESIKHLFQKKVGW